STPDERTITSSEISVGRFVPDHFTLVDSSVVTPACTAVAPGFTYMDQPFGGFSFTLEARNKDGNRTANYHATGTNNLANGTVSLLAENNDAGKNLSGRLASIPATSWVSGAFIVDTGAVTFNRAAVPDGPYDALQFGVKVNDPDGVVLEGLNMNADTAGSCIAANTCDGKQIGGPTQVRFGRLRLTNAYGSPRLNLPIPMRAEYYNGTTFVTNTLDSCTTISRSNIAMPAYRGGVSSANMTVTQNVTAGSTFAAGIGRLTLARPNPAATRKGSVDVCVDLGTDVPVTPARCVAATPVALPWLKGRWTGNGYDDDPVSRATFGIYKKSLGRGAEMIYFREMY
ncbi:MAG: DUF6701 domain-containing protein, partial [Burkholderiaceae bacterium]|nr:DUF6701 domain-containing protein [Burkholderiaceae bacterium]